MWVDGDHGHVIHHLGHPVQERDPHLYQSYSISITDLMSGNYSTNIRSQVSIHNITKSSGGLYTCLAWNKVGMEQRNVMLKVEKKKVKSENQNPLRQVAITLGSTAVVLVLILCL